jgi:nucleotide-binding universal stress UspA family protein
MSQLFQKILCAVDNDDACASALDMARRVAERTGGRLCVLHVTSVDLESGRGPVKAETKRLEEFVRESLGAGIDYDFAIRTGPVAWEIVLAAKQSGSDLIVIPTHGRSGLKRLALGSVAEHVVRESAVPVLTVKMS